MAPDVTYAYDNLGRLVSAAQPGQTLSFTFDALGRTLSQAGPLGAVSYQYDLASRRTRLTWPDGLYAAYEYDLTDAVTAIRETGATTGPGVLAAYTYDNLGRRVSVARGNGVTTAYAYDAAQRLLTLTHDLAGAAQDQSYRLSYNAVGQNLQRVGSNAAYAWPAPALGTTPYARNGLDQYSAVGAATPTYDSRGNLTGNGAAAYGYDALNRLTAAPGGTSLGYDPLDRLAQITIGTAATRFLQDGNEVIGEYDAGGALLRRYVPGPALDEPIVWYEGSGTSDRRWLLADPLGSVVAVTNAAGTATTINSYDEYGQAGPANAGRFGYTGALALPEAGLLSMRARAYDPALGRFLQTDPILTAGGINLYAYVGNDPINAVDPSGLGDPFLDEIIVHGLRKREDPWYQNSQYRARQDQLNAQQAVREWQQPSGSFSGERGDPGDNDPNSDEIVVIGQRPDNPPLFLPPPAFVLIDHDEDARPSTRERHERGLSRMRRDQGGERGDARRQPRMRPPNWPRGVPFNRQNYFAWLRQGAPRNWTPPSGGPFLFLPLLQGYTYPSQDACDYSGVCWPHQTQTPRS